MNFKLASFFIRLGLAISLFYAALATMINPNDWVSFLPAWVIDSGLGQAFLVFFAIFEFLLGLWLLSNRYIVYASLLTALFLAVIIMINITALNLLFRDIPIMLSALSLIFMDGHDRKK